jgi:sulfite oxidase
MTAVTQPDEAGQHSEFVVRQALPFNGGPPAGLLVESVVTPVELFFVRNHGDVPVVEAGAYRLRVGGAVKTPLALSLAELQQNSSRVTVSATLQCAGNRRQELMAFQPIPGELARSIEAIRAVSDRVYGARHTSNRKPL